MQENTTPAGNAENQQAAAENTAEVKKKKISTKWILRIILIAVIILIPVIIYLVKQSEISGLKEQQQRDIAYIQNQASDKVAENNNTHLETVVRVLSWAVRSEMIRSNMEQVNQFMVEMVKVKNYQQVVLLSPEGKVLLSTDKKYEGEGFPKIIFDQLAGDQVKIAPQKNGDLMASAPVYGLDKPLGTLVITYTPSKLEFIDTRE